nr:FAD-dependent pyridine nucleotide-disulfide oxidoreductase [Methylibium sp.]
MSGGRHLLLLGGGHSQLAVLQALARERLTGWQVTLVTPQPRMLYSGMLPGWMAGHYRLGQCAIDLRRLAAAAGVELRLGAAVALDAGQRRVSLADGGVIGYERLSLDIGSGIALGPLSGLMDAKGGSGQV